jgi:hypothetical protein
MIIQNKPDLELMQSLKTRFGTTIAAACSASSVPEAFMAALIANESGGNVNAKRFEHSVLAAIWEVLLGRKAAYGSLGRADLVAYVTGIAGPSSGQRAVNAPNNLPGDAFQRVDALATSWGLTQIMGYHALEFGVTIDTLISPENGLEIATKLLAKFAISFRLDITRDFEQFFRCWNGGHPTAETFDPQYVANGLERMKLWKFLT